MDLEAYCDNRMGKTLANFDLPDGPFNRSPRLVALSIC